MKLLKYIFPLLLLPALSQTTSKTLFYDSNWKGCEQSEASFFRVYETDSSGKPVGQIEDHFISGELQGTAQGAIYIDSNDDSNSKFFGKIVGYYKNGQIQFENWRDKDGNTLISKSYDDSGELVEDSYYSLESEFYRTDRHYRNSIKTGEGTFDSNGDIHGFLKLYHPNGYIYQLYEFNHGDYIGPFYTECDEFGKCELVVFEDFANDADLNDWPIYSESEFSSEIIWDEGLLLTSNSNTGFKETIRIPLNQSDDFSIETTVEFISGDQNSGHGLIWGFKDWNNYQYFLISGNGYYKIGRLYEGIRIDLTDWIFHPQLNQGYKKNRLKVIRLGDKLFYSINSELIISSDYYRLSGNHIGFMTTSGIKKVLYNNLIIRKELNISSKSEPTSIPSIESNWKGNGSGIFINGNGYIATNYHVVEKSYQIEVEYIQAGNRYNYSAEIVNSDKQNDLSIIKINDTQFKPLQLKYNLSTNIVDVGTSVFALGYPMALSIMGSEVKFTDGKVSAKTGYKGDVSTYQTTTPIQPGNSGGPLFDYNGNLIGINSSGLSYEIADNVSYSIKSSYLKNLIEVLPESINIPSDRSISDLPLTEQIKVLSEYVVLIKIK
ncbi:MAG: hypothetical protein CMB80_07335 [Flammeovirgaceae bacterium]|nr:hypothetical protein [Flammeovirgaceae bacterium]HCX22379.1 hypothetical protein [Cytophagales bacterium]|tara:strand:+ start:5927 stop:7744 length:1818 start_codon:yes stop_codon:yes gene_type:complete